MRPVAKITSLRACTAMIFETPVMNVFVNLFPICVVGALDTHGGIAALGPGLKATVFANLIPVCAMGDINDCCKWVKPPHPMQPLVLCDHNVFIM